MNDLPLFTWSRTTSACEPTACAPTSLTATDRITVTPPTDVVGLDVLNPTEQYADATSPDHTTTATPPAPARINKRRGCGARRAVLSALPLATKPTTLDEALDLLQSSGQISADAIRRLRSDVATATKWVHYTQLEQGSNPKPLPCDPVALRPLLHKVLPARHGDKRGKRWSNIKAELIRLLKLTGWHELDDVLRADLSPSWKALQERLPRSPQKPVFGFVALFCDRHGLGPDQLTGEVLERYRAWRSARTLDLTPDAGVAGFRRIWNNMVRQHADWPGGHIAPPRDPRVIVLPSSALPAALVADIDAYTQRMANPNPLDPVFNRKLAPLTIRQRREELLRAASVLVTTGKRAPASLQSVRDVVEPVAFREVMLEHLHRVGHGAAWSRRSIVMAHNLFTAATQWAGLTADELAKLKECRALIKLPRATLTAKSRDRIAQFDDPTLLARLLELPSKSYIAADRMLREGKPQRSAELHQYAIALDLLLASMMRREDIAELHLERHFVSDGKGNFRTLKVTTRKTGARIEVTLSPSLTERLRKHLDIYRPLIERVPTKYLFPGRKGDHMNPATIARQIVTLVKRSIGAQYNVQLVRHMAATMLLEEDPRHKVVAQNLLGHKSEKTTLQYYAQPRTREAHKMYGQILDDKLSAARGRRPRQ